MSWEDFFSSKDASLLPYLRTTVILPDIWSQTPSFCEETIIS